MGCQFRGGILRQLSAQSPCRKCCGHRTGHAIGYLRANSPNVRKPGCGNGMVLVQAPVAICWSPPTDREAVETLPKGKVAFGVATFSLHILSGSSSELQRVGFLGGQVRGRQTVPRARLWRAIQALSHVDETTNIQCLIDAKYVTQGVEKCKEYIS